VPRNMGEMRYEEYIQMIGWDELIIYNKATVEECEMID